MRRTTLAVAVIPLGIASIAAFSQTAVAKAMFREADFGGSPSFQLSGRPIGGSKPASATAAYLAGSRIAALDDGAVVIDADSGQLIRTDKDGKQLAALAIGKNAGLLTYDPVGKLAYVADRGGNRVAIVKVGASKLELSSSVTTPAEPFGIALSPDRKTVMVTTVADRTLVAFDTGNGKEKWRTALGREPRGLAVSPDGTRALVAYLATGTVDQIDLLETHKAEHIALSTQSVARRSRFNQNTPDSFARGAFTALFMGEHEAVIPFQRETPVQQIGGGERTGSYGGGFEPPIQHQLAFLATNGERTAQITATINQHQPRAMAWDASHDALYVAGLGSDTIIQLKNASQNGIAQGVEVNLAEKERCGPDGIAVGADGNLMVWCSFTRSVKHVDVIDAKGALASAVKTSDGPTLVASSMTDKQHEGMVLFHAAQPAVSQRGALACASCHPDGRTDGLSWRIDKQELQTPLLAGRVVGTHPYKWDGGDKDLPASLTSTMKRLGGRGLDKDQTAELAAYLESLPKPATPTHDTTQVARGEKLFDSPELGCRSCHDGVAFTDQDKHKFQSVTLPEADTPSLLGVAASAPYYHDGSAATLESLLRDRARVHGMAETAKLNDSQVADLVAFLESL